MSAILPARAFAPMLIFAAALAVSFVPPDWPATTAAAPDGLSLKSAERAIDKGEALAQRAGLHVAFVVLTEHGEPIITTEMVGTLPEARVTASRRATCVTASLRPKVGQSASKPRVGGCAHIRGADVVRHGKMPIAVMAVAGGGDVQDERILGAALGSFRP